MKLPTKYFSDRYYCDRLLRRPDIESSEWSNCTSTWKTRLGHEKIGGHPRRPGAYPLEPIAQPRAKAARAWRHPCAARLLCRLRQARSRLNRWVGSTLSCLPTAPLFLSVTRSPRLCCSRSFPSCVRPRSSPWQAAIYGQGSSRSLGYSHFPACFRKQLIGRRPSEYGVALSFLARRLHSFRDRLRLAEGF